MASSEKRRWTDQHLSLRFRLTTWVVAIFTLIQIVVGLVLWTQNRRAATERFDLEFTDRARNLALVVEEQVVEEQLEALDQAALDRMADALLGSTTFDRIAARLLDADGQCFLGPSPAWCDDIQPVLAQLHSSNAIGRASLPPDEIDYQVPQGRSVEVAAVPLERSPLGPVTLAMLTSNEAVVRETTIVTRTILLTGVFGMLASGVSGWLIAGIATRPLRSLGGVAEQLTPENIDDKLVVRAAGTEIGQFADELEVTRKKLRDAFAAQERFLSNISHELKTPIATLLTDAQTIDRTTLNPGGREFVESAEEEMRKLGRLVESFLTLTRVRDGDGVKSERLYLANELVMDAVEDCLPTAAQHGVTVAPSLADTEEGITASIVGDPALLQTMLNNLIRNAIRFSPHGGRVDVRMSVKDKTLTVSVSDQGPGIPPDLLDHVFDRFVQSTAEVRRERGHGLGLAIAKGIAELHRGDITATNLEQAGARFTATLPLASPTN